MGGDGGRGGDACHEENMAYRLILGPDEDILQSKSSIYFIKPSALSYDCTILYILYDFTEHDFV